MAKAFGTLMKKPMKKQMFTFGEVEQKAKKLLENLAGVKKDKLPKKTFKALMKYSEYQLGQLALYLTFEYYKRPSEKRQKDKTGELVYTVLVELYKYGKSKEFQKGFDDGGIKVELAKNKAFPEFVAAYKKHDAYYQNEKKEGRTPMPFINYLLEGLDKKGLPKIAMVPTPKKIDWLTLVKDETLNTFLSTFKVSVGPGVTKQKKTAALVKAFRDFFGVSEEKSRDIVKAVLYAYSSKLKEEERKPFIKWLKGMGEEDRKKIVAKVISVKAAKGFKLPTEVVRNMFIEAKALEAEKKKKEKQLEKELEGYSMYSRIKTFKEMFEKFEAKPAGRGIEVMEERLEYLTKKKALLEKKEDEKSKKELTGVEKELASLEKLLKKFGLKGTVGEQLTELRDGMVLIDELYFSMSIDNTEIIGTITSTVLSSELRNQYSKYLLRIDKMTGRIFVGLNYKSKNFPEQMRSRILEAFKKENMSNAMKVWQEYFNITYQMTPEELEKLLKEKPAEATVRQKIANLWDSPLLKNAFLDYANRVGDSGVGSEKEKEMMVTTAVKLAALHPLLVLKYFGAMRNLAYICNDNPDAYQRALLTVAGWVDGEVSSILNPTSPFQLAPPTIRKIMDKLDSAFSEIAEIDESKLAQYTRYDLMDSNIYINPNAPHIIEQRPDPKYIYPIGEGKKGVPYTLAPSPFPPHLQVIPPRLPFTGGGAYTYGPYGYGGGIQLPIFNPLQIYSGTGLVKGSVEGYLWPGHPIINITDYLPQTRISGLSATELINEIHKAFITSAPLGYSGKPIGGGGAGGILAKSISDEWEVGGGALGSILTSTGGAAFGGSYDTGGRIFAGGAVVMMPMGTIKKGVAKGKELGIESAVGGYEELDDGTKKWLLSALTNAWDIENPSEQFIVVNGEQTAEGKAWTTSRFFYVDKNGAIFELMGGKNDFVEMLNFLAGYFDNNFKTPVTGAWNIEPTKEPLTGGGALAFDIGKTAGLLHFQSVPFLTADIKSSLDEVNTTITNAKKTIDDMQNAIVALDRKSAAEQRRSNAVTELNNSTTDEERAAAQAKIDAADGDITSALKDLEELGCSDTTIEEAEANIEKAEQEKAAAEEEKSHTLVNSQQPLYYEWTPGVATTKITKEGEATRVYEITLPGKMMQIKKVGKEEQYVLQDAVFMIRQTEGKEAWELVMGGGLGQVAKTWEEEGGTFTPEDWIGRGGILFKKQAPNWATGAGTYLEAGTTNLKALAMLSESEALRNYVEGMWRVGTTLYGTGEVSNGVILGGLAHVINQFKVEEIEGEGKKAKYDATFWRFIGFMKALDDVKVKFDVSRIAGFENIMSEYNELLANVNKDPKSAATRINKFKSKYETEVHQIFDDYYLGVQITKNFSFEAKIIAKEEENKWTEQMPETAQARALLTWETGFWRVFASLPTWMPGARELIEEEGVTQQKIALIGTGFGFDVFSGLWLQRIAFDAGVLLAIEELETEEPGIKEKFVKPGAFVEGAVSLFSNILEDSKKYRQLVNKFGKYKAAIKGGRFDKITDSELRKKLCEDLSGEVVFTPALLTRVLDGKKVLLTDMQQKALLDNLWNWFYDEKTKLEKKFNGKIKTYLAAQGYIFDKDNVYWDAGLYFEYVDNVKAYLITAKREEVGLFSGFDLEITPAVTIGAMGGVVPATKEGGGGVSLKVNFDIGEVPSSVSVYGYGWSDRPENYSNAAYSPYHSISKTPEIGCFFLFTIGGGTTGPTMLAPPPVPKTPKHP